MEQPSSSSKVTVEYFDPFGVYQLLSPGLLPRLPLRNLHWDSHSGPLRSIQTLHVDLIPSSDTPSATTASVLEVSRVKSSESVSSTDDGFRTQPLGKPNNERDRPPSRSGQQVKGRRHQMPGLRQTPYLKLFLLRCDDVDTYKAQARKQVREWIKENTPPAQSTQKVSSQENHDAYEWLIVHVIVPNTAAATQARTSSKGSSTILEKLKADFNGSSKSAVDRIAQIRIGINDVPYDILPRVTPAIPGSYSESPKEHQESWSDLINKFKALILASFDMRVSQYEDDIKEKDAQRSLPGWNFCTFFILKEGLAQGFENVGLVEDVLVGYDELTAGLDAIIEERSKSDSKSMPGGAFLPYTEDLREQLERNRGLLLKENGIAGDDSDGPIDLQSAGETARADQDEIPLSASRKPYRELILSNNISIFDFRCYLFSRQLSLLLRLANVSSSREEVVAKLKEQDESGFLGMTVKQPPPQISDDIENLSMLAEICRRALRFIASISQIMRDDLLRSDSHRSQQNGTEAGEESLEDEPDQYSREIIENMVSSYTFSIAQQVLAQTSTKSLPIPPSTLTSGNAVDSLGHEQKVAIPEPKTMMHPARSTSLIASTPTGNGPPSPNVFSSRGTNGQEQGTLKSSSFLKSGLEELAAYRAELYLLSRNVLDQMGAERHWPVGWDVLSRIELGLSGMEEVDLNDKHENSMPNLKRNYAPLLHGIDNDLLRTALDNQNDFYRLYETLTDKSLRHYIVAGQTNSVQAKIADLAVLKYHSGDYATAASYFYRITPFYGDRGWEGIEMCLLAMYIQCLKHLKRHGEYVRVALKLLAKGAVAKRDMLQRKSSLMMESELAHSDEIHVSVDGYLKELLSTISNMQLEVSVQLQAFFATIEVVGPVRHHENRDSFSIQFRLNYLLPDELKIDKAKARLVPLSGGQGRDIWLDSEESVVFKEGFVKLQMETNVIIPGTYTVKQITLFAGKMVLSYDESTPQPLKNAGSKFFKCPPLLLYQGPQALDIKLSASRYLHLDRNRFLEIELSSGWNDVSSGELHIRAATGGLRLQTSQVKLVDGNIEILRKSDPGVICFGSLPSASKVKLSVPFSLEHDVSPIQLKVEISYTTEDGVFFFASNPSMSIMLPLGVNVQDVFKHNAVFSKFTISSATPSPLRLISTSLDDSDVFEATKGAELTSPVIIFPRQPASMLYKITHRSERLAPSGGRNKEKASLSLTIHYVCLEEEIDIAITLALTDAIKDTPLYQYSRLVIPTVLSQLHSRLSAYDYERAAMIGEMSTSMLSGVPWRDQFVGLGEEAGAADIAASIAHWLEAWRKQRPSIALLPVIAVEDALPKSRSIVIPVDIPAITVVYTADMKLPKTKSSTGELVAVMNQPIPVTLHIKWTRKWDSPTSPNRDTTLDFVCEISSSPDSWIIGGQRATHFQIPPSTDDETSPTLTIPLILIPIKEGHLSYPSLEIKQAVVPWNQWQDMPMPMPMPTGHAPTNDTGNPPPIPVVCETDFKNAAEVIRVVANARRTTVSIEPSGSHGSSWLVESERRGSESDVFVS